MPQQLSPRFVSFGSLGFFSRLYRQYCEDFEKLAPYYNVDYRSAEGRAQAADAAAAHPRDRVRLVEVLRDQNAQWGTDEHVEANLLALSDPASVAVVTGQQVGLFSGPLYTIYKTLTVLQMARRLASETGRKVVPVFWLESDDHDFAEISSVSIFAGNETQVLHYDGEPIPANGNLGPVGRIVLTDQIKAVVDQLDASLPSTDFKPPLMEAVRSAYRPGATMLDAFATLMRRIFHGSGLVFISPDDRRLKEMVAPLFEREVADTFEVASSVDGVSERLRADYHAQVTVKPSNLFVLDDRGRHPLDAEDGVFRVRGSASVFSPEDLRSRLVAHPETFSANVVLRPLVQDTLLPTAIYVAGPSEIAYFAQFKPVYDWAGIPMPAIFPRASATIVEGKVQKVLDSFSITLADVDEDVELLFQRIIREQLGSDVDAQFETAKQHLHAAVNHLRPFLERVDRTLVKSSEATRATLLKELDKFRHRVLKAEKRNHEQVRVKLSKAQTNLFPDGKPQERTISVLYFLNKYGMDLIDDLQHSLSVDTFCHQVLPI